MLIIQSPPPPAQVISVYVSVAPVAPSIRAIVSIQSEITQALAVSGPPASPATTLVEAVTKTEVDVHPRCRSPNRLH